MRAAVDTHGFTHVAMAVAKLMGFDLCPRLARLGSRRLYLPRGLPVPDVLCLIVAKTVSKRMISRGWDGLLRLASSIGGGWCLATHVLDRFGSTARGDPMHEAGAALGKLLRTIYLHEQRQRPGARSLTCSIKGKLFTASSARSITGAKHGRTAEQLTVISDALTLLANVIMT
jgi:TnpA family transposase